MWCCCFRNILSYYSRIVPLVELRRDCGISRDGSNAFNIVKAARNYGLNAKGLKKSLESLKTLTPPYIVFWNFNHFLVVEGFGKNHVYLNDPATGRRTVSIEEFDRAYTGIVLMMQPREDFQTGGKKNNIHTALTSRLKHSYNSIVFCLIVGLLLTIPRLAVPGLTQVFVDEILITKRTDWIRPLVLGMVLTGVLRALLARLRLTYLRLLMLKLSVTLSGQFLWHILRLPVGFYAQRFAGEISSRVLLNDKVADILSGRLATTVIDAVMVVFYFLIMLQYDLVLTGVAVGFTAINFFALQWLSRTRVDANMKLAAEYGKVNGVAIAGIQTIETIKASGLESDLSIHDLILSLPGGYDAKLIEGGMNISGGQRQRLEIARAIVRNPSVLVMDEATSALDAQTELIIDRNLRRRGCSCIVIAHRLSTIRDCDEIIVLEQGKSSAAGYS